MLDRVVGLVVAGAVRDRLGDRSGGAAVDGRPHVPGPGDRRVQRAGGPRRAVPHHQRLRRRRPGVRRRRVGRDGRRRRRWASEPQRRRGARARPGRAPCGSATSATTRPRATRSRCCGCRTAAATEEVEPRAYTLVYPDGAHDAETLLAHPRTGQLFVVSKDIFGGTVYAAPRELLGDEPEPAARGRRRHRASRPTGRSSPTGGTTSLRDYDGATVYTFPGHEPVGSFALPAAAAGRGHRGRRDDGRARQHRGPVHRRAVGAAAARGRRRRWRRAVAAPSTEPSASTSASRGRRRVWPWLLGGAVLAGFVAGAPCGYSLGHGAAS